MRSYQIDQHTVDSVELKALLISRGVKVDNAVYKQFGKTNRLSVNPMHCNCLILSDGTICQLTDVNFHLKLLAGMLSWSNLKLMKYASDLSSPFALKMSADMPDQPAATLYYEGEFVDAVTFPPKSNFYKQKTSGGLAFTGNAVIQGVDWVAFQCLWPCELAAAGQPCEYCFSGADFAALTAKGKSLPPAVAPSDVAEIVKYAVEQSNCNSLQLTGGSTIDVTKETIYLRDYLLALKDSGVKLSGEKLLYITPPDDLDVLDTYFELGASRVACSLEVWDEDLSAKITPGKIKHTTRQRHLKALEYVANKYGPGKSFSNFIIGLEPFETLAKGATYLAQRGVLPSASVWMPMGRPVQGSMTAPSVDHYRQVKELFAELYLKYDLEPPSSRGLNVCIERDIYNYAVK